MHAAQLQAEKVLRTWRCEKVFAADILADYEVSPILMFPSNLLRHCRMRCDLHCDLCRTIYHLKQPKSYAGNPERCKIQVRGSQGGTAIAGDGCA